MKNIFVFFLSATFVIMHGCQSDSTSSQNNAVSQSNDKIFGNLYVRYIQPDNQIKAEASFSKGTDKKNSKPVELKGGVSFQGSGLKARKILEKLIKYGTERVGDYKKEYLFGFNINDKKVNIPMQMASIDSIYPVGDLSISKGGSFKFTGEQLSKEEGLVAILSDNTNYAISFVVKDISNENEFNIPSSTLSKFKIGKGQIYLVRKKVTQYDEKNYELATSTEFYSNPIAIHIKK